MVELHLWTLQPGGAAQPHPVRLLDSLRIRPEMNRRARLMLALFALALVGIGVISLLGVARAEDRTRRTVIGIGAIVAGLVLLRLYWVSARAA